MTALPELPCSYAVVPRMRGQQLKEVAQLDGWLSRRLGRLRRIAV
ncbi:MAG: hypothetical protein QM757_18685 [Paludibaculum sp.]